MKLKYQSEISYMTYLRPIIGIVNLSSKVSNDDVIKMVVAIQQQLKDDVAPAWGRDYWFIMFFADPKAMYSRAYPIVIVDNDSTPGALGWHAEQGGKPYGKVMVDPVLQNGGVTLYDPTNPQNVSVSSVLSHEVIETFVDPYVNVWVDGPRLAQGSCYAMEACDPVESNSYTNKVSGVLVSLSNFVNRAYFLSDPAPGTKFDHMGVLSAPFSLAPGGYMVVRNQPGTEAQVYGTMMPPAWKVQMKQHKLASRTKFRMPVVNRKKWWKYLF